MKKLFTFISFLFSAASTLAQQTTGSHVQIYTTESGLPSNGIKGMQWDAETGFLWIATEAGIVRFNGTEFRSYTKENMPAIASERMLFITRNNSGTIYVSDLPGNIFAIRKSKPEFWEKAKTGVNPYYGNYYLLPVSDMFFRKIPAASNTSQFSAVTDRIVSINDTSFFILHQNTIYYQSISLSKPALLPFKVRNYTAVFKMNSNFFVVDNSRKVFLLNIINKSLTPVQVVKENGQELIPETGKRIIYWETGMNHPILIDGTKAWKFDYNDNKITARLIFNEVPADAFIRSVQYSEKNRTLFLGTDSKGLIVLNQARVETKKRINPSPGNRNSYYAQIELANGNILTNEGDIIGDASYAGSALPVKSKFSFSVSHTDDSLLWYVPVNSKQGGNSLHQYNYNTGVTKRFNKINGETIVREVNGNVYLLNNTGIGMLEGDSMRFLYKHTGTKIPFDINEISPGVLALATSGGLFTYNTSTHDFDTLYKSGDVWVRTIRKFNEYVFFGTYGDGFYIYKNRVVKSMPLDKNRYLLYTHCFVPDDNGFCWISTNRGLFKADINELINAFEKNAAPVYYHYFGKKDGMEMTEMNGGCTPCAVRLKNKIISFPTMDGLLWVDPEKAAPILPAGDIYIDEILADNKLYNPDSIHLKKLPAKTGEILFRLALPTWSNTENIYLDYQLNDTLNWKPVNIEKGSEIKFSNLPSGDYTLRIRKHNGFGFNNYTFKEIRFTITIPWHKQWWFYLLCALVFSGLLAAYMRFRTRQYKIRQRKLEEQVAEKTRELQKKNEVLEKNDTIKTRLISIISHDIVTPLKFLTVAGKNLIEKRNQMPDDLQQETLKEITNTSQELQLLSTNILNWIKYQNENRRMAMENFNLSELVNQVTGVLNSLARQKNLGLKNETNKNLVIRQFIEPLKILLFNLLSNAINFTEQGSIIIGDEERDNQLRIFVKDEGVGMTPEQIQNIMADQFIVSSANMDNRKGNGLGYLIIKDLVKMMGANLKIESEKGKGTTVSVFISLKENLK